MSGLKDILYCIGNTPMVRINKLSQNNNIFAKLESFNPGGSSKDRIALNMVQQAEKDGLIRKGNTLIEPTSGNTGIGLAMVCSLKGFRLILTMPQNMSKERRMLLTAFGAEIILTPSEKGMQGSIEKADELASEIDGSFICRQFDNPANPDIHQRTTGPEIWEQTDGSIDMLVCGVGTGGTITGCGRYLKSRNPYMQLVAVEPYGSPVISGGKPGSHKIQGIGAGFIPNVLDLGILDKIVAVRDEDAAETARKLAAEEGILAGISSGAAMWAAIQFENEKDIKGKNIVVLLPDGGERYISTGLFAYDAPTQ